MRLLILLPIQTEYLLSPYDLWLLLLENDECNQFKKENTTKSTSETIYPHNLSSIFNWTQVQLKRYFG